MKKILYILLLILFVLPVNAIAQAWTEPIQLSTLQGVNNNSDFCIDNLGIIHCVWSYKVESNYKHIYYCKSTDDGQTWSTPENVSQNTSLWMENPHIVADSENNLHLTYDYDVINPGSTLIVYRKYEDNMWSSYDTVSIAWPGARHNRLVIDHNDKLYCFWFHDFQNGTTFYRVLENGVWGEIEIPYDNDDLLYLKKALADINNNIICTGNHIYDWQTDNEDEVVFFKFEDNQWTEYEEVSQGYYDVWDGNDIALDINQNPHIVWRQAITNDIPPDNGTLFSKFDGNNWSSPIILTEDASEQAIAIDLNNKTHIIDNEEFEDGYRLVHYQLMNNEWVGEIIEDGEYGNYGNKIISGEHFLYMTSVLVQNLSPYNSSVVFRRYEIITGIENKPIAINLFNTYPNPTKAHTTISYSLKETEQISMKIYDIQGKLINTLLEKKQMPNKYQIIWNGTDKNNKEVKSGLYLIRLQAGRQFKTRSVEIIK